MIVKGTMVAVSSVPGIIPTTVKINPPSTAAAIAIKIVDIIIPPPRQIRSFDIQV